jgi:hypothetical protein
MVTRITVNYLGQFRIAFAWSIVAQLVFAGTLFGSEILSQKNFNSDPRRSGWFLEDWQRNLYPLGGWATGAAQPGKRIWSSPLFPYTPFQYYCIQFCSCGNGIPWVAGMGYNTNTSWGRFPSTAAQFGELQDDDWTAFSPSVNWTPRTFYTRARANAQNCSILLMGEAQFSNVVVTTAQNADVCRWADSVYASIPPLQFTPSAQRYQNLSRTRGKLAAGQTVRLVFVGDSIIQDMANSTLDVLLERAYPGAQVQLITTSGSGAGMDRWDSDTAWRWPDVDLNLDEAVILQQPDLVLLGGISSASDWQTHFPSMIQKVRERIQARWGYSVDVMLTTGAFGTGADVAGYGSGLQTISEQYSTSFLDLRSVTEAYFTSAAQAGYNRTFFYRDVTHANHCGKQILGRILLAWFSPRLSALHLRPPI